MPAIRFPTTALPLLALCKGHDAQFIFRTYADLIGFVSAYGFHLSSQEGRHLPTKASFAETPNAIGLEIFENRGLNANFLMMALAFDETRQVAEDEEQLTKLIEKYASLGAEVLTEKMSGKTQSERLFDLCALMMPDPEKDKI